MLANMVPYGNKDVDNAPKQGDKSCIFCISGLALEATFPPYCFLRNHECCLYKKGALPNGVLSLGLSHFMGDTHDITIYLLSNCWYHYVIYLI